LRQLLQTEAFDAIITVSLPVTGHLLGLEARRMRGSTPAPFWLADIGDPFSFQLNPPNNRFLYQRKNLRLERKILESADAVTVTTPATLHAYEAQFGTRAVARMSVIPPVLSVHQVPGNTVQAQSAKPDLRGRLEVHFYGEIFPEFYNRLREAPGIHLHGLCSREDAWAGMQQMDFLLNIGNTTDFQLPSKAVEYLATGKPVLHLSYVANDPFTAMFGEGASVLTLSVENGKVREEMIQPWLEWLESEKMPMDPVSIKERVASFLVENVAAKYLAIISPGGLQ
jgi:hypothetical protein